MFHRKDIAISGSRALFEQLHHEMIATPDAVVTGSDGDQMGYPALLAEVAFLQRCLPSPKLAGHSAQEAEETIALCCRKTPRGLAALLSVLASGRAYAPLDPTHPQARLTGILEDLRPAALILDDSTVPLLADWAKETGTPLLNLSDLPQTAPNPQEPVIAEQQLAAVLHTSGSTGKPKRAEIEAEALNIFQDWVVDELSLCIDDCLLSHAPFAFDLSFLDIYGALMAGAGLTLADAKTARNGARLLELITSSEVTVWHSAPSALKLLAEAAGNQVLPQMRCVLFAGEPMPARTLQKLFVIFPNARFINIYGCTETNDTFFYEVPRINTPHLLPLGRKLPYVDYVIVDAKEQPQEGACEGELWVRCLTMMRGYADAELTRRATVEHQGQTYYRSGDQVRRDDEGLLHFVGRNDTIVKLNGVRVDLNEVDHLLQSHPKVDEGASFLVETDAGKQLQAWVTSADESLTSLDLRLLLGKQLPAAALPRSYRITADPIPKNSNGKACRRQLATLAQQPPA